MSKITTLIAAATLLVSGAVMAQSNDFKSMVIDYGQAPGLSAKAEQKVVAKSRAEVVAELGTSQASQAALNRADAELGIIPAARKAAPAATMLAGQAAKTAQ